MPVYEYFCPKCSEKFEIRATMEKKEKGINAKCPKCGNEKTAQIFGNFFTFSKGNKPPMNGGGCCNPNSSPGCCG
jgi:putative FmdB family regulatory protein